MNKNDSYENFPLWIPCIAILFSTVLYVIGSFIISQLTIVFAVLYILYCISMEMLVILRSCKNCWYYNRVCGLGKGKIAPLFVKKGNTDKFSERQVSILYIIPDFMVFIFPFIAGITSIVFDFSFYILLLIIIFSIMFFGGTAFIRGTFACKYCKQKEIGCPAFEIFEKKTAK